MFQLFGMIRLKKTYFPTYSGTFSSKVKTLSLLLGKKKSGKAAHYGLHRSYLRYFLKTRQNILEKKNTEWPTQPYTIWENILSYQCSNNIDATPQTASLKPPWNLTSQIQVPDPGFHFTKEWSQDPNAAKIHRLYHAIECTQCWFKTTISSGTKTWSIFLFLLWLQLISLPGSKHMCKHL